MGATVSKGPHRSDKISIPGSEQLPWIPMRQGKAEHMSQVRIPVDVDEDVVHLLGDSLEEMKRHVLEVVVLDLYRKRELSSGRAAQLLGLDRFDFIRWSGSLGIPFIDMTPEEWQQELRVIDSM